MAWPVPALTPHHCTGARHRQSPSWLAPALLADVSPSPEPVLPSLLLTRRQLSFTQALSPLTHTSTCHEPAKPTAVPSGVRVTGHLWRCHRDGGLSLHLHFQQLFKFKIQCAAGEGVGLFYPVDGWSSCCPLAPLLLLGGDIANCSLGMRRRESHLPPPCF